MFKLRARFFTIIFLINVLLVAGLYVFLHVGFEHTFADYATRRERELAEVLAARLEEHYERRGNWTELTNPEYWARFIHVSLRPYLLGPPDGRRPPPADERWRFNRHWSERAHSAPMPNFFLADANKKLLIGIKEPTKEYLLQTLNYNNQLVGYLGVPLEMDVPEYLDNQIATDNLKNLTIIAAITLTLAFFTAFPLSHLMVRRITALAGYVQKLRQGKYDTKLDLRGNDELNALSKDLAALGSSLETSERQRQQWAADISHELRTPVAILQADLEAMEDGIRTLDNNSIHRLQDQVRRLSSLVGDLHDLTLTDMGALRFNKSEIDLEQVIAEAVDLMGDQFSQHKLQLNFSPKNNQSLTVFGDRQRLLQVFLNLLQNSLKYTDAPGVVSVQCSELNGQAVVEIEDSAPGVKAEQQAHLSERLFRVDNSRNRKTGGAGLGLALCANILKAHEGSLRFSDSTLGGLKVTVVLPLLVEKA